MKAKIALKIAMGADHRGFALKEKLIKYLKSKSFMVKDCGTFDGEKAVDYPVFALKVCGQVIKGDCDRGILVCGTGIGMSIAANKVPGIRAALVNSIEAARLTSCHNRSNVLCLSSGTAPGKAKKIADAWFNACFEGGRHGRRVDLITEIEKKYCSAGLRGKR